MSAREFPSFDDFYPFYLREHSSRVSRRLHVIGTALAVVLALAALVTFRHPLYSLRGDFTMLRDVLTGRLRW